MKQTLLRSCCRESSTPILNWLVTCHWWRAHSWERRRKIWIPRLSFTQGHILPKMPLGCLSNCISQGFWNQLKRKWLSPSQDFCYFPFLKNSWFFFSVKTAHSYLMPRVLSNLRDQHSSNYTMSWHTAHAALEPNGSILPLAEISTGEEGREGSQPDTQCKSHWCQGFLSQTLQLQWAILQLWPLWSSGPSAEWRRKSSPVIQFPQGATGEVKGQGGHSVGPRHNWPPQPWFTTTVVSNTEEKELGVLA